MPSFTAKPLRIYAQASDEVELEVLPEAGARLHRLRVFGHDVLRTPRDPAEHVRQPFSWGGYQMLPWCNRIAPGKTQVADRIVDLPPNFPDGTAIHGQAYVAAWEEDAASAGRFRWSGASDGWPWEYSAVARFGLAGTSVIIEQSVVNHADTQMPTGVGIHPWFLKPVKVAIAGDVVFDRNTNSPPVPVPVRGEFDRRFVAELPDGLDATWAQLTSPQVRFRWPTLGIEGSMTARAVTTYVVAASPTDMNAVAVEPQTHAPDGLRRLIKGEPGAMTVIGPGEVLTLETTLTFSRTEEEPS